MKIGVICSSGGSVLMSSLNILNRCNHKLDCVVLTDRECSIEKSATEAGYLCHRIEEPSRKNFSSRAASWLIEEQGVNLVSLFFTRLISADLHQRIPCVNFHPSLLPAFRGFGALEAALQGHCRFLGATAHYVDDSTDAGPILAQVVAPIRPGASLAQIQRLSFAQKIYLFLLLWESNKNEEQYHSRSLKKAGEPKLLPWANPGLRDSKLEAAFWGFLKEEGIEWIR